MIRGVNKIAQKKKLFIIQDLYVIQTNNNLLSAEGIMARKKGIPGLSFSWKRAIGLSNAKSKISRNIGIPLTRTGRQRKMGKAAGCCVPAAFILIGGGGVIFDAANAISKFWV